MPALKISAYSPEDRPQLITLLQEAFPDDPPWNAPELLIDAKCEHSPQGLLVGFTEDGTLAAAVLAGYDGHRGWINTLCVMNDHRGKGYGHAMLDAALAQLKKEGAVKINLQIRGDNTALQDYYARYGFVTEDRISMGIKI